MAFMIAFCLLMILGGILSLVVHLKNEDYNLIGPIFMFSVGCGIIWYLRAMIDSRMFYWGLLATSITALALGCFQLFTGLDKQWRPAPRENGYVGIVLGSIILVISLVWKKFKNL